MLITSSSVVISVAASMTATPGARSAALDDAVAGDDAGFWTLAVVGCYVEAVVVVVAIARGCGAVSGRIADR